MRNRTLNAFTFQTGDSLGQMEFQVNFYGHPHCPKCNKVMEYWEGQIDQDYMGNDISGWNHVCYACDVQTEVMEGSGGYVGRDY
jgi:alpha-glucuronidase